MKVSVIIPVYNAVSFVDRCIQSALDQPQTGEVIVIDDRSTDGSWEKCEVWKNKDGRVKIFKNEGVKGAGAARNVGLKNATYNFIAFLDADDYFLDNRFEEDELQFKINTKVHALANSVEIRTIDGLKQLGLNAVFKNLEKISFRHSYNDLNIYDFYEGSSLHLNGLTIRKSILKKVGKFDENLKQTQDTDFTFRLFLIGKVFSTDINKAKAVYNIHHSNTIKNLSEAIYFRRKASKKHFHLALEHNLNLQLVLKFFINFVEYDHLWYFGKSNQLKKFYKLIMLPFYVFRIYSKNDPEYDKDRTIHQL